METFLAPLPLLKTDLFESNHSHYKQIKRAKRSTVNVLYTMITNDEKKSVYHSTGQMIPSSISTNILGICSDQIVLNYLKKFKVPGDSLYHCSKLIIYGTEYKKGNYIVLPNSTNTQPYFGKISKLLCCKKFGYFIII